MIPICIAKLEDESESCSETDSVNRHKLIRITFFSKLLNINRKIKIGNYI